MTRRIALGLGLCLVASSVFADDKKSGDEKKKVRTWRYRGDDCGVGTISGRDGEEWTETRPFGQPPSTFKFVRRTNRFTELFDKDRDFTLILYWDGESEWSVGEGWNSWLKGTWEQGPQI